MLDFTAGPHASCYIDVNHERAPYKGGPDSSVCKVDQRSASERRVRLGVLYISTRQSHCNNKHLHHMDLTGLAHAWKIKVLRAANTCHA